MLTNIAAHLAQASKGQGPRPLSGGGEVGRSDGGGFSHLSHLLLRPGSVTDSTHITGIFFSLEQYDLSV